MSELPLLKISYLAGVVIFTGIRSPFERRWKSNVILDDRMGGVDRALLVFVFLTMMALPLVYVLTPWLSFANYRLPLWAGAAGGGIFAVTAWLFWRSHHDLNANWSPSLQLREGHELITSGIYSFIRHPMYAAIWLWVVGQILLLQNWVAGPPAFLAFGLMYAYRRTAEEAMMADRFGDSYRAYVARTPRLLPRLRYRE